MDIFVLLAILPKRVGEERITSLAYVFEGFKTENGSSKAEKPKSRKGEKKKSLKLGKILRGTENVGLYYFFSAS
jgi:hypothetical protein